ncbi:hypothetical protein LOZ48_006764, partial [Ophidiomyces ophidiicola]
RRRRRRPGVARGQRGAGLAERRGPAWHARPGAAAARAQIEIHARGGPAAGGAEGEQEPDVEADCRLLPGPHQRHPTSALLHQVEGEGHRLDGRSGKSKKQTPQKKRV